MRKVEVRLSINTSPKAIIDAFTDQKMLKDWWQVERSLIDLKVGGLYTLTWNISDKGFGYVSSGIISKYDPDSELVIGQFVYMNPEKNLLGPMNLAVRAIEKNSSSQVYLCQDGYQNGSNWDWYYEAVKSAWPVVLQDLKKYLENT